MRKLALTRNPGKFDTGLVDLSANLTNAPVRLNLDRLNQALYREGNRSPSRVVRDLPLALHVSRAGSGWCVTVDERAALGIDTVVLAGVTQDGAPVVTLARADVLAPDRRAG